MSIKPLNTGMTRDRDALLQESWLVREDWQGDAALYDNPLAAEMEQARALSLLRTKELMDLYARRSPQIVNAVETFAMGNRPFLDPGILTGSKDRKLAASIVKTLGKVKNYNHERKSYQPYLPDYMVKEFEHGVSDFRYLTLACVNRQLRDLSREGICGDSCLDGVFRDLGTVDYCENRGSFSIVPVKAPAGAGCPDGDCGDCAPTFWKFGETERGFFSTEIYKDYVRWDWELGQCAQYAGWTDQIVRWMLRIQEERRLEMQASILGTTDGINTEIFNTTYGNVIKSTNGSVYNPSIDCTADAIYLLEAFMSQWSDHKTLEGMDLCNTGFKLVTGDYDLACIVGKAIDSDVTETMEVTDADNCVTEVRTTSTPCIGDITPCYDRYLKRAMGPAAKGAFFIIPNATGDQAAFERANVRGFEQSVIARKRSMFETLGGAPMRNLGSNYCWGEEVGFFRGFGVGSINPEIAFASDGSGAPSTAAKSEKAAEEKEAAKA